MNNMEDGNVHNIVKVDNLSTEFSTAKGVIKAVNDVSFSVIKAKLLLW